MVHTLGHLAARPELELRFAQPRQAQRHVDTPVAAVVTVGIADGYLDGHDATGALVLITGRLRSEPAPAALDRTLRNLAHHKPAALVIAVEGLDRPLVPEAARTAFGRLDVPLLISTGPHSAWNAVKDEIHRARIRYAEHQIQVLNDLLKALPDHLDDCGAMDRIAGWLADATHSHVVVLSPQRGVLAAVPNGALGHLQPDAGQPLDAELVMQDATAPYSRMVALSPSAADARLIVNSATPFDAASTTLIQHAARLLGFVDEARRIHRTAVEVPRGVRRAVFQLLMVGQSVAAARVCAGIAPGLLDTDEARVYVIATPNRPSTMRQCEKVTAGRALVTECPGYPDHVLVVDPTPDDRMAASLCRLVASSGALRMGGSQRHALTQTAEAYCEAYKALQGAAHYADRVNMDASGDKLAPLLDRAAASAWARTALAPILELPREEREPLLATLPVALPHSHTMAAGVLGIHRNTVRKRVARVQQLLRVDLSSLRAQIPVLLAMDILDLPDADEPAAGGCSDLYALLSTPAVKEWAERILRPIRKDKRRLMETMCAWMETEGSFSNTALTLGITETTVRNHKRAVEQLLRQDLSPNAAGVQDLALAMTIATGRPNLSLTTSPCHKAAQDTPGQAA